MRKPTDHKSAWAEFSAAAVAQAIARRDFSAREYAECLLARIADSDLGAIIALDPPAVLRDADAADQKQVDGGSLGLLHGVPFVVKDNISTAGLPASAGTPSLQGNRPLRDAAVVAALKTEGAIVLGKVNMHELAAGVTTDNAAFGRTHNPYDSSRSAGGSSGGTAAASRRQACSPRAGNRVRRTGCQQHSAESSVFDPPFIAGRKMDSLPIR